MPSEFSVKSVTAVTSANDNAADPNAENAAIPPQATPAQSASPMPNPQLRLDPALGLVVIEFRDASGAVTNSIPSQRQLNAYRIWEQMRPDPASLPGADALVTPPGGEEA